PNETEIDKADIVRPTVESEATPPFPQWLWRRSLGNTDDDALGVFPLPCDTAFCSPDCTEVGYRTVSPQNSVPALVIQQSRIACHPSLIINAVSRAISSAKRREVGHLILHLCFCLCLCHRRSAAASGDQQG